MGYKENLKAEMDSTWKLREELQNITGAGADAACLKLQAVELFEAAADKLDGMTKSRQISKAEKLCMAHIVAGRMVHMVHTEFGEEIAQRCKETIYSIDFYAAPGDGWSSNSKKKRR